MKDYGGGGSGGGFIIAAAVIGAIGAIIAAMITYSGPWSSSSGGGKPVSRVSAAPGNPAGADDAPSDAPTTVQLSQVYSGSAVIPWVGGLDIDQSGPVSVNDNMDESIDLSQGLSNTEGAVTMFASGSGKIVAIDAPDTPNLSTCQVQLQSSGVANIDAKPGDHFCVMSGRGAIAGLSVTSAGEDKNAKVNLTVWH
ncbi:hypothetical protein ACIQPR_05190 [Streptomyces sp. NPDC091280]|uniref:hypothetical protein n=1 Tax=Streptomyces sp. NPDC091280 TaxID=3365984 RepID=UPI0037FEFEEA